jgi:hypothetical protein
MKIMNVRDYHKKTRNTTMTPWDGMVNIPTGLESQEELLARPA